MVVSDKTTAGTQAAGRGYAGKLKVHRTRYTGTQDKGHVRRRKDRRWAAGRRYTPAGGNGAPIKEAKSHIRVVATASDTTDHKASG